MSKYFLILHTPGPEWIEGKGFQEQRLMEHGAYIHSLYEQGILIRDVSSYPMLSKCLRISVGTREENDRLLSALRASPNVRAMTGAGSARESK